MNWLAIINELFSIAWLSAMLVFLILIWYNSVRRTSAAQQALINLALKDSESARMAVETTRELAAIIQNQQAR